jgi:hypothetical protein
VVFRISIDKAKRACDITVILLHYKAVNERMTSVRPLASQCPANITPTFGPLQMSTSAVLTILSLFSAHVLAQVYSPNCTVSALKWVRLSHSVSLSFTDRLSKTFNSIGQNPCTVAAYLLSTCNGGCQSSFSCTTSHPHLTQLITSRPSRRDPRTLALPLAPATCASAAALYIPS